MLIFLEQVLFYWLMPVIILLGSDHLAIGLLPVF